jgi:glycosyltransferase involved in cell wall biosynthesis
VTDIDVVIPVRNGGRLLQRAVDSVLNQQGVDVHLVVVDDGSVDGAPSDLIADPRLRVVPCLGRGIPDALETGIAAGSAPFIARQDADDESLPGRLRTQLEFMNAHAEIGLTGTYAEVLVGEQVVSRLAPSLASFGDVNPIVAGSVVMRRDVFLEVGGHRRAFSLAEDYDLWLRIAGVAGVAILPILGYRYRLSATQSSVRRPSAMARFAALASESARAVRERRPDPVEQWVDVGDDVSADMEALRWWAHEFRALGSPADADACARDLPPALRDQFLEARNRGSQAVWG